MASKNGVLRLGVIGPGGAGRGNTLAFATRKDVLIVVDKRRIRYYVSHEYKLRFLHLES